MRSPMTHKFSEVPRAEIPRSSFDRSHGNKFTMDANYLIPIFADEGLPGDTFNLKLNAFARMNTPIFPIMDNLFMDTFFFEIPIRLLWDNWQKFNGEQTDPGDSIDYTIPQMVSTASTGYSNESLHDYLGIPTKIPDLTHSSLWHRAYNLIYNEWFRDQNLINSVVVDTDDGPDDPTDYVLLRRGKRHDYFTSALPWPQKSEDGSVSLPLGTRADVKGIGSHNQIFANGPRAVFETDGSNPTYAISSEIDPGGTSTLFSVAGTHASTGYPDIYADLSEATAATINQLRQAFQIQRLIERDARGGSRYTEIIRSHFGVTSPDARLQRPSYLGGGSQPINISPIPQTSSTDGTSPQGNVAALGTVSISGHGFTKSFTEHVLIIGLVSVRADLTYQQGLPRMFSRTTRYDHYWPSLSVIGEQTILNKEIYAQGSGDAVADAATFGYQERYAEFRYKTSTIGGKLRSNDAASLDPWHLSQDFSALPTLGQTFIEENVPMARVQAVTSEPDFIYDSYIQLKCARPMPVYGVPGMLDRF